jgi:hypothetical protein
MSNPRSVRYRRLAMVESDPAKANLLYQIADEADRGVLVTTEGLYSRHGAVNEIDEGAKESPPA